MRPEKSVVDPMAPSAAENELEDRDSDAQAEVEQRECNERDSEDAAKHVGCDVRPGAARLQRDECDDAGDRQREEGVPCSRSRHGESRSTATRRARNVRVGRVRHALLYSADSFVPSLTAA